MPRCERRQLCAAAKRQFRNPPLVADAPNLAPRPKNEKGTSGENRFRDSLGAIFCITSAVNNARSRGASFQAARE